MMGGQKKKEEHNAYESTKETLQTNSK